MKLTSALISLALLLAVNSLHASDTRHNDEAYIDDIPFDTRAIFDSVQAGRMAADFRAAGEDYIDDIPFDTRKIAAARLAEQAMNEPFRMPDEPYIDDIPFNTRAIASGFPNRYHTINMLNTLLTH